VLNRITDFMGGQTISMNETLTDCDETQKILERLTRLPSRLIFLLSMRRLRRLESVRPAPDLPILATR
jgi:mitochondrial fission protein ELM1